MKKFRKILKYVIMAVCVLGVFSVTAIALILEPNVKIHGFASLDEQKLMVPVGIIRVLDDDGDDIAPNAANKNRRFTPLTSVPAHTRDAFVAIEDKRFYKHGGIDYGRVAAAAKKDLASRSFREGASTITQQLIKNTHLSADKSLKRKVQEMRIARALERKFSKDEILEMYLNILYFGNRLYGIDAAADAMFGKSVPELSLAESALLAGIINNPSRYNPYSRPENAVARRNLVLSKMTEGGKITKDECAEASAEALQLAPLNTTENRYMSASIREAAGILGFGEQELYRRNVTVATSLDGRVQSIADAALAEAALEAGVVAQVLVINNHSGEVLGFSGAGGPNLEILRRNPASTVKPALVYAPAIEKRLAFPITPILDEKTDFNGYSPDNYKHRYEAWTSVGDALAQSSNVCAVKLMEQCGVEYCQNFASGLGYDFTGGDGHLALSLGAMENGLTLLQIANSFQAFANGGCFIPAGFIRYSRRKRPHFI
ncbi:MAG: penicillin-binding protein [Firmicutes bacterium]|nr:penicillin-binding protein [Bacillota bacterium]